VLFARCRQIGVRLIKFQISNFEFQMKNEESRRTGGCKPVLQVDRRRARLRLRYTV